MQSSNSGQANRLRDGSPSSSARENGRHVNGRASAIRDVTDDEDEKEEKKSSPHQNLQDLQQSLLAGYTTRQQTNGHSPSELKLPSEERSYSSSASAEINDMICTRILLQVFHIYKTPNHYRKAIIGLAALLAAGGAVSTSQVFGRNFVKGLNDLIPGLELTGADAEATAWVIAACNIPAQGSLTMSSIWDRCSALSNHLERPKFKEIQDKIKSFSWKELLFLLNVPLSCLSSGRMVFGAMDETYHAPRLLSYFLAICSSASSLAVNANFALEAITKHRGVDNTVPVIAILTGARIRLFDLAHKDFPKFLKMLDNKSLLKNLNGITVPDNVPQRYTRQMENIFDSLLDLVDGLYASGDGAENIPASHTGFFAGMKTRFDNLQAQDVINTVCKSIAILVSLTNVEAGMEVPMLFGLATAEGLAEFFTRFNLVSLLSGAFGIASGILNTIINGTALQKLVDFVVETSREVQQHGPGILKKLPAHELLVLCIIMLTSVGYGAGKGGATIAYPAIKDSNFGYVNLVLSTVVFIGLGSMSQKGLFATVLDLYYRSLLNTALAQPSLAEFYDTQPEDKKLLLRRLLSNNSKKLVDQMVLSFQGFTPDSFDTLFSQELTDRMIGILNPLPPVMISAVNGAGVEEEKEVAVDISPNHLTPPRTPAVAISSHTPLHSSLSSNSLRMSSSSPIPSVPSGLSFFSNSLIPPGKGSPPKRSGTLHLSQEPEVQLSDSSNSFNNSFSLAAEDKAAATSRRI